MAKLDLTPWGRQSLSGDDYMVIQRKAPLDSMVSIGMARKGEWTCRILVGGSVVGEAYKASSAINSFYAALRDMKARAEAAA